MSKDFIRAFYSSWGSGVTGTASAPLFVLAFLTSGVPRIVSSLFAVVCLYVAAYLVWVKERKRVIELQGRPEVSLTIRRVGGELDGEWLFGLSNASGHTAMNVSLAPVTDGTWIYEFDPVPSIVKSPVTTYVNYHGRFVDSGGPLPPTNTDMVYVLGLGNQESEKSYPTALEFSHYGTESRWRVDYLLKCNFSTGAMTCVAGSCRKVS